MFKKMLNTVRDIAASNGHINVYWIVILSFSIPFGVTLNGRPNGEIRVESTVRIIIGATIIAAMSVITGKALLRQYTEINTRLAAI